MTKLVAKEMIKKTLLVKGFADEGQIERIADSALNVQEDRSAYMSKENLLTREEVFVKLKKGKAA